MGKVLPMRASCTDVRRTDDAGDELGLAEAAFAEGVMFDPGSAFRPRPREQIALRLSYSNAAPDALPEAARRLARALDRWRAGPSRRVATTVVR